jgi:hypothetical protein
VKPINEKDEDAQLQDEGREFSIIVSNKGHRIFCTKSSIHLAGESTIIIEKCRKGIYLQVPHW